MSNKPNIKYTAGAALHKTELKHAEVRGFQNGQVEMRRRVMEAAARHKEDTPALLDALYRLCVCAPDWPNYVAITQGESGLSFRQSLVKLLEGETP